MRDLKDSKSIINYLHCLGILENNTSLLYHSLAKKVEMPQIKKIFKKIALDSSKHSFLLEGMINSYFPTKKVSIDCGKNLGKTWVLVKSISDDIKEINRIGRDHLSDFLNNLEFLESSLGEEYYVFLQMKTLYFMVKKIDKIYDLDLGSTKQVFSSIIDDEEYHRELLGKIKEILSGGKIEFKDNTPLFKYKNPDLWR